MIQRIQSVFLGLLALISIIVSFSKSSIANILGNASYLGKQIDQAKMSFADTQFYNNDTLLDALQPMKTQYILWVIALWAILTLVSFKNRKRQITFCSFNFAFILFIPIFFWMDYSHITGYFTEFTVQFSISTIFPLALLILNILAVRGIVKDHNLIKSMDRMR